MHHNRWSLTAITPYILSVCLEVQLLFGLILESKLLDCTITLQSAEKNVLGTSRPAQVVRDHAAKLLGTEGLDLILLHSVFGQFAGSDVWDIRHFGVNGLAENDNNYWLVIFSGTECPSSLLNVT